MNYNSWKNDFLDNSPKKEPKTKTKPVKDKDFKWGDELKQSYFKPRGIANNSKSIVHNREDGSRDFKVLKDYNVETREFNNSTQKLLKSMFKGKNPKFFLNPDRLSKSGTFSEDEKGIDVYTSRFTKENLLDLFIKGVTIDKLSLMFPKFEKSRQSAYLKSNDGRKINFYYIDVLESTGEQEFKENLEKENPLKEQPKKEGNNMKTQLLSILEMNKEAGKQAGVIKIGKTANKTVVDILQKKVLPKKYAKLASQPIVGLLLANVSAVALKQLSSGKKNEDQIDAVANAMITSSMIDITNLIDINEMIGELMDKVDLGALGFGKDDDKDGDK